MHPAEQESLLLRQVAALRRSGLSHGRALEQAASGLPAGALSDRVQAAQLALRTGDTRGADPLLAQGTVPVEALDLAARALDAGQAADAAVSMARVYLMVGLVGPLLVGTGLAWLPQLQVPELLLLTGSSTRPGAWAILDVFQTTMQFLGLPTALGLGWLILRRLGAHAPGVPHIQRAAALLQHSQPLLPHLFGMSSSNVRRVSHVARVVVPRVGRPRRKACAQE